MIDISCAALDIIRLSSPPCVQVRVSDNTDVYIHRARIRPIGCGVGISRGEREREEILTIVSVRLIHELSVEEGKKKEQTSEEKERTDHNCFIIEVLLYSTSNNNNNTCVYISIYAVSLINIADIGRGMNTCIYVNVIISRRGETSIFLNDFADHSDQLHSMIGSMCIS